MQEFFQERMDYIFLACGLALILLIHTGIIIACRAKRRVWFLPETLKNGAWLSAGIALVFAAGFFASHFTATRTAADIRDQLLNQAISIAETINAERIKTLSFTAADKGTPAFERLRAQLVTYGKLIRQRSIYSMTLRNGKVIFGPENIQENDPLASPPGTVYARPSAKIFDLFNGKSSAITVGPYRDEYGTFISAFARVPDPRTGNTILVIGLDVPINDWNARLAKSRLPPMLGSLIFLLILLGGAGALKWSRQPPPAAQQQRPRHLEGWLAGCLGLFLTIAIVIMVVGNTNRHNEVLFDRIAGAYLQKIALSFYTLRENIHEIGVYCGKSDEIGQAFFRAITESMVHMTTVKAFEWIPRVPADAREELEAAARQELDEKYMIWEKNEQNEKTAAKPRPVYYPILWVEPSAGFDKISGFDVFSEQRRRAAIETCIRTRLVTATEPGSLLQEHTPSRLIMVYQPVFRQDPETDEENGLVRGFVLAILNPQDLFNQVLSPFIGKEDILVALYDVTNPDNPKCLATHPKNDESVAELKLPLTNLKPVFCFGRTYIIIPRPKSKSPMAILRRSTAALFAGLGGLGITLLFSTLVVFVRNRQADLENQVCERTAELRSSEEDLAITLRSIGDALIATDPEGRITKMNPVAEKLTGWRKLDAIGRPLEDVFRILNSVTRRPVGNPVEKVMEVGRIVGLANHTALISRDGAEYQIADSAAPIRDAAGRLRGVVLVFHDVTAAYKTSEALRESEARYKTLFTGAAEGIAALDLETKRFIFANPAICRLFDYSELEFSRLCITDLHPKEHSDYALSELNAQKLGKLVSHDMPCRRKDGSVFYADIKAAPIVLDGRKCMVGFFTDVTERKCFEKQLSESEKKYRRLVELAQEGIWLVDAHADTIYINPRMAEMLGYTVEELIGRSVFSFLDEKGIATVKRNIERRKQGFRDQYDLEFLRKDGQRIYTIVEASQITDDNGNHLGSLAMIADITQRKLAEQALAEKNLQLQEMYDQTKKLALEAQAASLAKGRFVANISHEIRTPLNGIIGISDLLMGTKMTPEQKEYAKIINASAESLLNIINSTLDFSKIEAGKIELEHINFNLRYIIEDIIGVLAVNAFQKNIEVTSFIEPAVPLNLNGDPGRLRQILFNLIGNAIKFTSQGEIVVTVALVEENETTANLRFSVRDTGIGIPSDKIALLFTAFTQADESFTRKFGGTGLGLAISKGLVQQMEGKIGVESIPDKGSNFWFVAPFLKQNPPVTESFEPEAYFGGQRILIVDDNETNRTILAMQLQAWGALPETAEGGAQALQKLLLAGDRNQTPFSAAVMDQRMPDMDGLTLAKNIKADPELQELPLILMTSMILSPELYEENKNNFAGIILKPIRQSHLYYSLLTALTGEGFQKTAETTEEAAEISVSPHSLRILVAEDNITNQKVICGILNKMGHSTTAVANGKEALDMLKTIPFDLVLMDIQMPEMDGFEAAALIRDPKSGVCDPKVPILALTAHAMEGDRQKCLELGMNGYISKPVTTKFLVGAIGDIIAARGIKTITREMENKSAPVVFDEKSFADRLLNDRDLMLETIRIFRDDAPKRIGELDKMIGERKQEEAVRLAHMLKGSSANVSGRRLSEIAMQIETACNAADWRQAAAIVPKLQRQFESLSRAMEELQARLKT